MTARRPTTRRRSARTAVAAAVVGAALAAAVLVAAPAQAQDGIRDGAEAAAQAYVDAIAAGDAAGAHAMTDPAALARVITGRTDLTGALPDAVEHIDQAWVQPVGPTAPGGTEFAYSVSYLIGDQPGGGGFRLALQEGADPTDVESWVITLPLVTSADLYAAEQVDALVGEVPVSVPPDQHVALFGYPGRYEIVGSDQGPYLQVEPIPVLLGADVASPWDAMEPRLVTVATPQLVAEVEAALLGALQACADSGGIESDACAALPEPWSVADDVAAHDGLQGSWEYEPPRLRIEPESLRFSVTGGVFDFHVTDGVNAAGEPAAGRTLGVTRPVLSGEIEVDGERFSLVWD